MKHTPIKLGPLALLLAVISICLTTLALLNFSTAQADRRLAEKYAETVSVRYALETEGQELLASLDPPASFSDWESDGEGRFWTTLEQDGFRLQIGLAPEGESWRIVAWTHEKEWELDTHIDNLWTGG
jgi:hypothetical protein